MSGHINHHNFSPLHQREIDFITNQLLSMFLLLKRLEEWLYPEASPRERFDRQCFIGTILVFFSPVLIYLRAQERTEVSRQYRMLLSENAFTALTPTPRIRDRIISIPRPLSLTPQEVFWGRTRDFLARDTQEKNTSQRKTKSSGFSGSVLLLRDVGFPA